MGDPRRRSDQPKTEDRERQRSARDGEDAVAGAMQQGEGRGGPAPEQSMTAASIGWVMQANRVETSGWKRPKRLASRTRAATWAGPIITTWAGPIIMPARTACAGVAPNASTMRGHRRRHHPGRGEGERQQHHGPVDPDVRLDRRAEHSGGPFRARQHQVQRQPDDDVRCSPREAGLPPADRFEPDRAEGPADRTGEAGDQRYAGDGAPRIAAVDPAQRAEGPVVETETRADAEQQPGGRHHPQ